VPNPIQVLGDRDTVLAFALGGVPGRAVQTGDEARAAIDAMVREVRESGGTVAHPRLLLVTLGVADSVRDHLDAVILDANGPLVLEIPGLGEPLGQSPAESFVQRVLGVHL